MGLCTAKSHNEEKSGEYEYCCNAMQINNNYCWRRSVEPVDNCEVHRKRSKKANETPFKTETRGNGILQVYKSFEKRQNYACR